MLRRTVISAEMARNTLPTAQPEGRVNVFYAGRRSLISSKA